VNKHGLSRYIPADVARRVREHSKQGCIFCRALICEYEHIEPEFAEAKEHDADRICLVCPSCHRQITSGLITKAQVRARYAVVRQDASILPPFHRLLLSGNLTLELGDSTFEAMPADACVLRYDDERLISVGSRPDEHFGGERPSISGTVNDAVGNAIFTIDDNIITLAETAFDVVARGSRISISVGGRMAISLIIKPPGGFAIDRLVMKHRDLTLNFDRTFGAEIQGRSWELPSVLAKGARAAVAYNSTAPWRPRGDIEIVGGVGVVLPNGLTLAEGAGSMEIRQVIGRISRIPPK
jgi:hypothetical protein